MFQLLEAKRLAYDYFYRNDFSSAVAFFTQALDLDPNNYILLSNRSASYAKLRQYENALLDADVCLRLNPNFVKGYSRKGDALHGLGRDQEAASAYSQGLVIDPTSQYCSSGLQRIHQQSPFCNPQRPLQVPLHTLFQEASYLLHENPLLRPYENDPDFKQLIGQIRANPSSAFWLSMVDPRIQLIIAALTGLSEDEYMKIDPHYNSLIPDTLRRPFLTLPVVKPPSSLSSKESSRLEDEAMKLIEQQG
jgi:stress-induced-phosphoprotein 1